MNISICLLSDTPWGDFPTWVQAGCAMITLMLVIMGLLQNRRIQELTEIVSELKIQSEILQKQYELERVLALKDIIPYFEKRYFNYQSPGRHDLGLVNVGVKAIQVEMIKVIEEGFKSHIEIKSSYSDPDIPKGRSADFRIAYNERLLAKDLNFSFTLRFYDGSGREYSQLIKCIDGRIVILPPSFVLEVNK